MKRIVALGTDNKSCFSVMTEKRLYFSEPVDNLADMENFRNFETALRRYIKDNNITLDCVVSDANPDYCSTILAQKLCREHKDAKFLQIQHHFAHIAACMMDNGIDEDVIGVSFDGTGFGRDGKSWGGEFFLCNRYDFRRISHLKYIAQPGADFAARQGWRMAIAYLLQAYGEKFNKLNLPLLKRIENNKISVVKQMIEKDINSPLTSSAGRLFDAVSSILGICDVSNFEAEAAVLLEGSALSGIDEYYDYTVEEEEINLSEMIKAIVKDLKLGLEAEVISSKFHNTLGEIIFDMSARINNFSGADKVLVSGGCFQNKYLRHYLAKRFAGSKLKLYTHNKYSTTDIGIAAGQVFIAAGMQ